MSAACEQVQVQIAAYVDRELAGADYDQIAAHVEHCALCAAALAEQQQVKHVVHAHARALPAPVFLRAAIRRSLSRDTSFGAALKSLFEFYPRPAVAALASFALLVVALTWWGSGLSPSTLDPMAYQSEAVIVGKIICADCTLMQQTHTVAVHTPAHHLVLQTREGKIWTIVLSPAGEQFLQKAGSSSHLVEARGYAFPRVGYMQVLDFAVAQN